MRPQPFVDLLERWVANAHHPAVAKVWTCAHIGRPDQPYSPILTLDGDWTAVVQVVATSPPQGDQGEPTVLPNCEDLAAEFDDAQQRVKAARGGMPPAGEGAILQLLLDAIKTADHADVADVFESKPGVYTKPSRSITVRCADGYTLYVFVVGYLPPGHTVFPHPIRDMPEGWR